MSERTLKQLVGALAIAVGVWIVTSLLSGGPGSIAASGEITEFVESLDSQSVTVIRIDGPDGPVALTREGDTWTVNGFASDSNSISRLLDAIEAVAVGDLVATNPDNHDRTGVSTDSAVTVDFVGSGGAIRTILVGKGGRRMATAYVRLPDADDVYLLYGDLRAQVVRRLDNWRDRTMVALDTANVARISIERDSVDYTLVRGDSTWRLEGGDPVNPITVNGVLSELSSLMASGFIADGDSIAMLEPGGVTRAYSDSGEMLAEISIGTGSGDRWARTSANDYVYRISSFRVGRVTPTREAVAPGS